MLVVAIFITWRCSMEVPPTNAKDLIVMESGSKTHWGERARQRVSNCCGKAMSPAVADFSFTKLRTHSVTFESSHWHKLRLPSRGDHSEDYGINRKEGEAHTSYITSISRQMITWFTYWWRLRITDLVRSDTSKGRANTNVSIDFSSRRC